jgi:hypothetical protein
MENLEKTLNEELRNNDCIENLVNAIDSQKSIYDAFVVDGKLVVVFNDELEANEVEKMQTMLKSMDGCGEVFSDEFELGYKENFKSLTLDLLTDNISIGKFEKGGEMEDYYDGQGDEGDGNTFEELRSQIVLGVMKDLRIPRETAEKVVDEKKEMLTDLIENHGQTNIYSLVQKAQEEDDSYSRHMETRRRMRNDEDTYPKGFNQFEKGGKAQSNFRGIDLFEDYEMQEPELKKIIQKINDAYDKDAISTLFLNRILRQTEKIGYTFEFDMDGGAYGLRPIGVDIIEVQGYEEYAKGGVVENEINNLYAKSNFTNNDFNWQSKLLEMLQDVSIEAYEIYQSLTPNQKQEVLKELYKIDNDMGSDGDGNIETSKENLEILLDDAQHGSKYAKGGEVKKISTTTQVKRNLRGSGAFTLELEMAVYVPSTTVADQIISKTLFQKRIQEVEKYVSKLFGGYSSTSVEGGYVSKEKGLIKEDVAKVTAFGTEESLKKNFKPLMRQISKWCESWGQESMGFEFEGDLYYVSKDAKFSKGGKIENKPVKPKFVKNAKK